MARRGTGEAFVLTENQRIAANMVGRAREHLAAAETELALGRMHVAFEAARTAAELASKALLQLRRGSYPKKHPVATDLFQEGILTSREEARRLHEILAKYELAAYGFDEAILREQVESAISEAQSMIGRATQALESAT